MAQQQKDFERQFAQAPPEQRHEIFNREFQRILNGSGTEYQRMHVTVELSGAFLSNLPAQMERRQIETVMAVVERISNYLEDFSRVYNAFIERNSRPSHSDAATMAEISSINRDAMQAFDRGRQNLIGARADLQGYLDIMDGRPRNRIGLAPGQPLPTKEEMLHRALSQIVSATDSIREAQSTGQRFFRTMEQTADNIAAEQRFGENLFRSGIAIASLGIGFGLSEIAAEAVSNAIEEGAVAIARGKPPREVIEEIIRGVTNAVPGGGALNEALDRLEREHNMPRSPGSNNRRPTMNQRPLD